MHIVEGSLAKQASISPWIYKRMGECGISSLRQLAFKAGLHEATMRHGLSGRSSLSIKSVSKLAIALDVKIDVLATEANLID
jgi:hypothetical protein